MFNVKAFARTVVGLIAVLSVWRNIPLPVDPFSPEATALRGKMAALPVVDVAAAKMAHAEAQPRYDVGLFGSSRIYMVRTQDIGLGDGLRVFNFALGSQSFHQSVILLEELARKDKLPRVAVISFDHVEMGLPGLAVYPSPPGRWLRLAEDAAAVTESPAGSPREVARLLWNGFSTERDAIANNLNIGVLSTWTDIMLTGSDMSKTPVHFRADGSHDPYGDRPAIYQRPQGRLDVYPLLETDMRRLAAVQAKHDLRVIVYESPLEPGVQMETEARLSANGREVRARFQSLCMAGKLTCLPAPLLPNGQDGLWWPDYNHPPGPTLGAWIGARLRADGIAPLVRDGGGA